MWWMHRCHVMDEMHTYLEKQKPHLLESAAILFIPYMKRAWQEWPAAEQCMETLVGGQTMQRFVHISTNAKYYRNIAFRYGFFWVVAFCLPHGMVASAFSTCKQHPTKLSVHVLLKSTLGAQMLRQFFTNSLALTLEPDSIRFVWNQSRNRLHCWFQCYTCLDCVRFECATSMDITYYAICKSVPVLHSIPIADTWIIIFNDCRKSSAFHSMAGESLCSKWIFGRFGLVCNDHNALSIVPDKSFARAKILFSNMCVDYVWFD